MMASACSAARERGRAGKQRVGPEWDGARSMSGARSQVALLLPERSDRGHDAHRARTRKYSRPQTTSSISLQVDNTITNPLWACKKTQFTHTRGRGRTMLE